MCGNIYFSIINFQNRKHIITKNTAVLKLSNVKRPSSSSLAPYLALRRPLE